MAWFDRFNKRWANTGQVVEPNDAQAAAGFAHLGPNPPTVEEFNALFQWLDDKDNWLYWQVSALADHAGVPVQAGSGAVVRDAVNKLISNEATARSNGDTAEANARWAGDNQERIWREQGDANLASSINAETAGRVSVDNSLNNYIGTKVDKNSGFSQLGGGNAFVGTNPGYCRLPNGLLMQFGTIYAGDVPGANQLVVGTLFPVWFNYTISAVVSPVSGYRSAVTSVEIDNAGLTVRFEEWEAGAIQGLYFRYLAIGG